MSRELAGPPRSANYFAWLDHTTREEARARLEAGYIVLAFPNGGVPMMWKAEAGYRFRLMQPGVATRDEVFATAEEAIEAFCAAEASL